MTGRFFHRYVGVLVVELSARHVGGGHRQADADRPTVAWVVPGTGALLGREEGVISVDLDIGVASPRCVVLYNVLPADYIRFNLCNVLS